MTEPVCALEPEFDACAGANYGVHCLTEMDEDCRSIAQSLDSPMLYWLLSCETVAHSEDAESIVGWLRGHLGQMTLLSRSLSERLTAGFRGQWAAWLPIILLSSPTERTRAWTHYEQAFPAETEDQAALRLLLARLIWEHGQSLFDTAEADLQRQYGSPSLAVTIKLGKLLKQLHELEPSPHSELFGLWRSLTRESVFHRLMAISGRVVRGFAPDSPSFEDLVLSLLAVAEWLTQPDRWQSRVSDFLTGYAQHPEEKLSPNQVALCGALYGYVRGYRRVGNGIHDLPRRRLVSRQSLAVAINRLPIGTVRLPSVDPVIFYATERGTRDAWSKPFLQVTRACRTVTTRREVLAKEGAFEPANSVEGVEIHEELDLCAAGDLFRYSHECNYESSQGSPYGGDTSNGLSPSGYQVS